jgi:T5SS/PEP-CTERM-associated repeat protein
LADELVVGSGTDAHGYFTISDSATGIINSGASIGSAGGEGAVTVEGNTSLLFIHSPDTTSIGQTGSGGLSVLNGGSVSSYVALIPGIDGGIGSALVDGEGSRWDVSKTLSVGLHGVGFFRLTNQGTLQANEVEIGPLGSFDASGGNLIIGPSSLISNRKFIWHRWKSLC